MVFKEEGGVISMINELMKQEKLKLELRMIFNDKCNNFQFVNSNHMNVVLKYGKIGFSFEKSLKFASLHPKIYEEFSKVGHFLDEDQIFNMVTMAIKN